MTDPAAPGRLRHGRPTLLTDELADRIVEVVGAGNYLKTAAQYAGVSQSTLLNWMARGRAAAAQVEAHEPDRRYCPSCDADRDDDVRSLEDANAAEADRYAAAVEQWQHRDPAVLEAQGQTPPVLAAAVLNPCPSCGSGAYPASWELRATEAPFLSFLQRVTQAETKAEVAAVTHWRRAFSEDWRAARDYLGRKRPEQWAAKTTITLSSEEAEARIEAATLEALTALGVDTGVPLDADEDPPDPDNVT